jgi:MoaA/NifB/PqqE/SkfB family radical SAM enzyme
MHSLHEFVTINPSGDLDRQRVAHLPILVIHAHSSCNCRCMMCDIWKTKENRAFKPSDLEPHLASIRRLGVRWIVFSGGEPLLNPELALLCSMLKAENIHLTLLTTGLLLGKCAAQVADSFDDVIVSLDGPEEVHDSIRRVKSAFALVRAGIAAVRQLRPGISITARTTVQKQNLVYLRDTVQAAKQLGLNAISFLAADLTSQAFNRPQPWTPNRQNDVALSVEELTALEAELEFLIDENASDIADGFIAESPAKLRRIARHFRAQLGLESAESPLCNAPWISAVVETDGTVRPCFFHRSIGNLSDRSLYEIINGDQALAFRSVLDISTNPTCNRCVCSLNYKS